MISSEDLEVLLISMDVVQRRADSEEGGPSSCLGDASPLALVPAIFNAPGPLAVPAAKAIVDLIHEVQSYRRAARVVGAAAR